MPKLQLPKKLLPLIKKNKRFKVIIGGRGSGKSQSVADIALMDMQTKSMKVGCFREFQNSISDSVYSLLCDEIERLELDGFNITANEIDSGKGKAVFKGLARNPESIKSMHGFDRFVVEEAQTISDKSLKLLTPTLRTDNSEIWFIANPQSSADPLSQRFIVPFQSELDCNGYYEDDLHLIIVCNYKDNPFFPDVLEQERLHDFEHLSRAEYDHIWLGKFNDEVENSIIKPEWFDAAIDAHKLDRLKEVFKPHGAKIAAHDPFDGGNDAGGIAIRHGSIIEYVADKQTGEIDEVCDWATSIALNHKCDWFIWDGDGMGTGLKRQVSIALDGTRTQYQVFKGSLSGSGQDNAESIYLSEFSKAENTTYANTFKNNRAQYYIQLADRFYNTYRCVEKGEYIDPEDMISINSDGIENITALRSEICRIPRKLNNNGLYQIMSKQDMARLGIKSPNMSDSVMMTMFKPKVKRKRKELKYNNLGLV